MFYDCKSLIIKFLYIYRIVGILNCVVAA